jgi:hypothetical protein
MLSPDQARRGRLATHGESVSSDRTPLSSYPGDAYSSLLRVTERLIFEKHRIDYDRTGRYDPLTDTEFPLDSCPNLSTASVRPRMITIRCSLLHSSSRAAARPFEETYTPLRDDGS